MNNFYHQDAASGLLLSELGACWHLWTPENHPVIFTSDSDFKSGINLLGFAAQSFLNVRILTFVLMSNHLHICCAGVETDVLAFFEVFKKFLVRYMKSVGRIGVLKDFICKCRLLDTLEDVRNVIVYDNRNPVVVNPAYTPYSYPWGAGYLFFNIEAKKRYDKLARRVSTREARVLAHSRVADYATELMILDDYISPISFCSLSEAERLFRSPRDYFHLLARNIESNSKIAMEIGESAYYDDQDLYEAVIHYCRKQFGKHKLNLLSVEEKLNAARHMKYQFNASNKQLQRILKLDSKTVETLFPRRNQQ